MRGRSVEWEREREGQDFFCPQTENVRQFGPASSSRPFSHFFAKKSFANRPPSLSICASGFLRGADFLIIYSSLLCELVRARRGSHLFFNYTYVDGMIKMSSRGARKNLITITMKLNRRPSRACAAFPN